MLIVMQRYHSLQERVNARRSPMEKLADQLTGSFGHMSFLIFNFIFFGSWIIFNLHIIPGIRAFDPYPFNMLTTIVSLEAIILAIIVLMSQNRAAHIADIREEIDLQMDVITEKEITKLLEITKRLAEQQGIDLEDDKILKEMLKQIDINKVERILEKHLH